MGYNLKAPWRLAELENQNIPHIAQTTSSRFGGYQATGHCSVDLKLGSSGDFEDKLAGKFLGPGDNIMESSSSGSSKRVRTPTHGNQVPSCLVDGCISDLSKCREYHRRHKVCELHSKTPKVFIKGHEQRFCQQCSRFHSLVEFDEGKRSCRKRLDGHNRRRRKPQQDSLSVNSARLFANQQGARYLQFGGSQVFSGSAASSVWAAAVKPDSDQMFYAEQFSLNIGTEKNFPAAFSRDYRGGKQFSLLQCSNSAPSVLDAGSSLCSSNSSQVTNPNRALSLLSCPPEIGLSHRMVQAEHNHLAQGVIPSLNFNSLGMENGAVESVNVMVSEGSSNANLHSQDVFQIGLDGSSASGSHRSLSFSWE